MQEIAIVLFWQKKKKCNCFVSYQDGKKLDFWELLDSLGMQTISTIMELIKTSRLKIKL